uniref:Uncharacterized protein n=1 Tax=Nelumbo nucifera TaxID=4432 RepID=A0A822Z6Z6_NELNU|nr:TPA_asm: hypothetical protein HUJ06_014940 [Nelumbo nucifera]DAD40618.1 TPA_asm: hypothetical protein HUJ06_014941 [Nelumbo nucifera]
MEVLSCSNVKYAEESNQPKQSAGTTFMCGGELNCLEPGKQAQAFGLYA